MRRGRPSLTETSMRLALVGALLLTSGLVAIGAPWTQPQAWIDQPLNGSLLPLQPVVVTAHATDPDGVASVDLIVDGEAVGTVVVAPPANITVVDFTWIAGAPGRYQLTVRGQGVTGKGSVTSVLVSVEGADTAVPTASPSPDSQPTATPTTSPTAQPTVTTTAAPTASPTAQATASPTPAPCTPPAPDLHSPSDGFVFTIPDDVPPTLRWGYRPPPECAPSGFRVQIAADRQFNSIVASSNLPGTASEWTPPVDALANCATYSWRVTPRRSDGTLAAHSEVWSFSIFIDCG